MAIQGDLAGVLRKLDNIANVGDKIREPVDQCLTQLEGAAKDNASGPRPQNIDKVTGNLVNQIQSTGLNSGGNLGSGGATVNKLSGYVESRAIYSRIHEEGGVITPKTAPRLAWQTPSGEWRFANMVIIPPRPFMKPAFDANKDAMVQKLTDAIRELIQ